MNELPRDFDRIVEDSERSTFTAPSSLNDRLSTAARNGLVSRPRLQILQQQLQTLHSDAGFRWADDEFLESPKELCAVEDMNLGRQLAWERISVREILEVTPSAGQRLVEGGLRQRGLRIQRHRIQESIRRVDPVLRTLRAAQQIIRRVYSVPCPNALW